MVTCCSGLIAAHVIVGDSSREGELVAKIEEMRLTVERCDAVMCDEWKAVYSILDDLSGNNIEVVRANIESEVVLWLWHRTADSSRNIRKNIVVDILTQLCTFLLDSETNVDVNLDPVSQDDTGIKYYYTQTFSRSAFFVCFIAIISFTQT